MQPSAALRRRSSMFDPDDDAMTRRKSRMDSMVSFTSTDSDFDKLIAKAPGRRESRLAYENTYQVHFCLFILLQY